MLQKVPFSSLLSILFLGLLLLIVSLHIEALSEDVPAGVRPYLVKRGHRRSLVVTEYGEISAAEIGTGTKGPYHIQFITLEPNSLLLPVLLHAEMVFYVNTGNGKLSWTDGREMKRMSLQKGDVYRLQAGSVFFVQSNLDSDRQKMRIHAIFSNTDEDIYEPSIGAYSSISDTVLGFDRKVLQAAFKVPEEVLEEITSATKPPAVVHAVTKDRKSVFWELEDRLVDFLIANKHKKTKETKTFNILDADPDFENCNGWSLTVDKYGLKSLRDSNIGIFMVNLTKGSMMGPHWNPMATEIAVVLHGQGMVRVVCPSTANESKCKNMRFKVKEGDVFAVPRFHPMAQMSFNNDSFVFMGFSTSTKRNHPQFLTGKSSILRRLDRGILAVSFNVTNTTMDQLLNAQEEALILDCTSCAEEEESKMKEEIEKEKQEEEARKREQEEEEKEREDEEARKKEEEKKREEEAARKREEEEEEAKKREEEEREREEAAAKKREEEEREEEEARKKEEEKKREEEGARKREEEAARRREEGEEAKKREEEEEEEEEEREREGEEAKKREEEKRRKEEEEEERREQEEAEWERKRQEEKQRQEEGEEQRRRGEEEKRRQERQRQREEAARREHEEARSQEEERQKRRRKEEEKAEERERREEGGEQPEEQEVEARKEDQERKGDEGKRRRALRKVWKL